MGLEAAQVESEAKLKKELAVKFLRQIRNMDGSALHELILSRAGDELAQFFLSYATDLMEREPARATENASSLLLIGYLIRCFEEDLEARLVLPPCPSLH